MKSFFRNNGLSLVLLGFFLLFWTGQMIAGRLDCNDERTEQGLPTLGWIAYMQSPHFLEATMENWESEFLQMGAYIFLTAFLFQKGSAESNDPEEKGGAAGEESVTEESREKVPWPVRRGGWVLRLYENSLGLAFLGMFTTAFLLHGWGGSRLYSEEQTAVGKPAVSFLGYLGTSRFWFESFQNWQSEFLAIVAMVVLSIFLRQRGSAESKRVAAPMSETGA